MAFITPDPGVPCGTATTSCCVLVACASNGGRLLKSVDLGVTWTELDGSPIGDGSTPVSCAGGGGEGIQEVYSQTGPPVTPPAGPNAVSYDLATNVLYVWDAGSAAWEPADTGPVGDPWLLLGNAGTVPLGDPGGTDFVGTTDTSALVLGTDTQPRVRIDSGGTVTVSPDGTNTRVTVTDAGTNVSHTDGTDTTFVAADSVNAGFGFPGVVEGISGPDGVSVLYAGDMGASEQAGIAAMDPGFSAGSSLTVTRDAGGDQSQMYVSANTSAGAYASYTTNAIGGSDYAYADLRSQMAGGPVAQTSVEATAGATRAELYADDNAGASRRIAVWPDHIDIYAGDYFTNLLGGSDRDILVRNGAGANEVRFLTYGDFFREPFAEQRTLSGAAETFSHNLNVPQSTAIPGQWPVTVAMYEVGTGNVIAPDTVLFDVDGNTVTVVTGFTGAVNVFVSRAIG